MPTRLLLLLFLVSLFGCFSNDTERIASVDEEPKQIAESGSVLEEGGVGLSDSPMPSFVSDPPETAQDFLDEVEALVGRVNASGQNSRRNIDNAIALAEEGYDRFSHNKNVLCMLANVLYSSLSIETDADTIRTRRLRLGDLARAMVRDYEGDVDKLLGLPETLLLEEAKAHVANAKLPQAWKAITMARDQGFDQISLLYLAPEFDPLVEDPKYATTIKGWLETEVQSQMSAQSQFPFDFRLRSFEDKTISLDDFRGKPLIVECWETKCGTCRATIPQLVQIHRKYAGRLGVVGINFESGVATYDAAKRQFDQFVRTEPISYPCLFGEPGVLQQVRDFSAYPTTLFLDRMGRVRWVLTGYQPQAKLEAAVELLLAEKPNA